MCKIIATPKGKILFFFLGSDLASDEGLPKSQGSDFGISGHFGAFRGISGHFGAKYSYAVPCPEHARSMPGACPEHARSMPGCSPWWGMISPDARREHLGIDAALAM